MMGTNLSPVAARRIQSELKDFQQNPPEGFLLESCEPMTTWVVLMQGPEGSAGGSHMYDGQLYRLQVKFPDRYPLESPEVTFLPETPVHPHIYSNGHICLDILYDSSNGGWSPALTVNKICLSLRSMLASNTENTRPPGDADYCSRVGNRSPKLGFPGRYVTACDFNGLNNSLEYRFALHLTQTRWMFDDDKV